MSAAEAAEAKEAGTGEAAGGSRRRTTCSLRSAGRGIRLVGAFVAALGLAAPGFADSPILDVEQMTFVASRGPANELVLDAAHARFDTGKERVYLDDVHAVVEPSREAGHFEIRCDQGELDLATNDFEARGHVRGQTEGDRSFVAPWVRYDHDKGVLFTDAPVTILEDAITYRGGGFQYFVRERRFKLLGGASVVQKPEPQS